ncbi:MAG TPA: VOC family protein [Fimbriimonas sp.]|nr:VOC family protein [Fimbriimonas sp.]
MTVRIQLAVAPFRLAFKVAVLVAGGSECVIEKVAWFDPGATLTVAGTPAQAFEEVRWIVPPCALLGPLCHGSHRDETSYNIDMSLTPLLAVHDCLGAIQFYKEAFGAFEEGDRHEWEGKVGHAEMRVCGALVMIADEFPEFNRSPQTLGGTAVILHLEVDDVDAVAGRFAAAGGEVVRPPANQPYGRVCTLKDPYGHAWMLNGPAKE